jgi:DNA-binding HxlR family transcriptional regulator
MTFEAPVPGRTVRGSQTGRPLMAAFDLLGRRGVWELRDGEPQTVRALQAAAELSRATLNTRLRELKTGGLIELEGGSRHRATPGARTTARLGGQLGETRWRSPRRARLAVVTRQVPSEYCAFGTSENPCNDWDVPSLATVGASSRACGIAARIGCVVRLARGAGGDVMLVGAVAPGGAAQRGRAGAPWAWLPCGRPRAEVGGCAGRQVGGYGSLPLASPRASGPRAPGRLSVRREASTSFEKDHFACR